MASRSKARDETPAFQARAFATTSDPASVVAFFDLDNTLLEGSSIYYIARGLMARRVFTVTQIVEFAGRQFRWATSGQENLNDIADIFAEMLTLVAGRTVEEVVGFGEEIYAERMKERIYPQTRALAQEHLAAGHQVYLVTAAAQELAELFARELGFTGALGTRSEVVDGVYTGRMMGKPMHGPAKATAIRALAKDTGFDLAGCYAYSDSANDLPMLESVGHPNAINPDPQLAERAQTEGWPSHDFRGKRVAARTAGAVSGAAVSVGSAVSGRLKSGLTALRRSPSD
ncbi:MAG: HAD-IB family hydrolase [Actinomycetia bacterium]|nr:HAD-IB family hydrolase [Actinomycetes bacterium]